MLKKKFYFFYFLFFCFVFDGINKCLGIPIRNKLEKYVWSDDFGMKKAEIYSSGSFSLSPIYLNENFLLSPNLIEED